MEQNKMDDTAPTLGSPWDFRRLQNDAWFFTHAGIRFVSTDSYKDGMPPVEGPVYRVHDSSHRWFFCMLCPSLSYFAVLSLFVPLHRFLHFLFFWSLPQRTWLTAPAQVTDNQTDTTNEITAEQHLGRSLHAEL